MVRPILLGVSGAAALALAACASGPSGPVGDGGGDLVFKGVPNLFISPAGRPFRAERDRPYPVAQWFAEANAHHNGRLTREEFRADAAAFFKSLDTNQDGIVDGFEVQHYERDVAPEINPQVDGLRFGEGMDLSLGRGAGRGDQIGKSPAGGREEAGDRRPEGAGLFGLLNEPEPVAATDTKFDGHITLDEFLAAADRRFTALDKKGAGYLTLDTLPKTPAQIVLERAAARRAKRDLKK